MYDTWKNNVAHTHPYHGGEWCSKFAWIWPSNLEEIAWGIDGWTMDTGTNEKKNNAALAHPYHVGKRCNKFGWIPPSGLGWDCVMDRCTDNTWTEGLTQKNNVALTHPSYEKWCSKFGWILASSLGGDSLMDRWMDKGWTDALMEKKMLLSHTFTMRGSDLAVWLNSAQWF